MRVEHRGNLLGVAIGRFRHVGQARVNEARTLIRGLGEGGQTLVKHLRALSRNVGHDGFVRVECGADRGLVHVEHRGNLLGVAIGRFGHISQARVE